MGMADRNPPLLDCSTLDFWLFLARIASLPIKPAARDYYIRWAESWISVETTMIYLHVMKRPGAGAPSPLDLD